jgi:UDP-N-acetylglucosamine transferase subunit ALG13
MIFVTVGTHEQPFNRLIEEIDKIKAENLVDMIGYEDMDRYIHEARIVITHGGPASFIAPLSIGKIPIVVPRQKAFNEHVNNHQLEFAKEVAKRKNSIIVVENIKELKTAIVNYDETIKNMAMGIASNNVEFNKEMNMLVSKLFL